MVGFIALIIIFCILWPALEDLHKRITVLEEKK